MSDELTKPTYDELEAWITHQDAIIAALRAKVEALEQENSKLQQRIGHQRKNLSRKYHGWAETKVGMQRTIEYLRAKAAGETPLFGHGAKDEIVMDLNRQLAAMTAERDRLREAAVWAMNKVKRCSTRGQDYKRAEEFLAHVAALRGEPGGG